MLGFVGLGVLVVSLVPAQWLGTVLLVLTLLFAILAEPLWREKTGE